MSTTTATTSPTDALKQTIVPFVDAVREVFRKMVGVEAVIQPPYAKKDRAARYSGTGSAQARSRNRGAAERIGPARTSSGVMNPR